MSDIKKFTELAAQRDALEVTSQVINERLAYVNRELDAESARLAAAIELECSMPIDLDLGEPPVLEENYPGLEAILEAA